MKTPKHHSAGLHKGARAIVATKDALLNGTIGQLAAGIAYYGTLSFFPLVAGLVAVASLTLTQQQVASTITAMESYLPKDIYSLFSTQLQYASTHHQANMVVALVAIGFSIFGASGAMDAIMRSINLLYGRKDDRSFVRQKTLSVALTVGLITGVAIVLPAVFIGGSLLAQWGMPPGVVAIFDVLRWVVLLFVAVIALGVVYHYAAQKQTWKWFTWGSVIATVLWLVITAAFFVYLQYFSNFSNAYSLFAGVIALMIWINFSALSLLVGADVNRALSQPAKQK